MESRIDSAMRDLSVALGFVQEAAEAVRTAAKAAVRASAKTDGKAPPPPRAMPGRRRVNRLVEQAERLGFVSVKTAADYLGISEWNLGQRCMKGDLPFQMAGAKQRVFRMQDLKRYKEARRGAHN